MSILENEINWPRQAQALAKLAPEMVIAPEVRAWLDASHKAHLVLACSGGADSVYLLSLIWALRKNWNLTLHVAHYNHCWRGEESDKDAQFVAKVSHVLGCAFYSETCPAEIEAKTETSARSLRMNFLKRIAIESGSSAILFGHQKNDILETQLQRLGRGAGIDGLCAPRPVHYFEDNRVHLRPLLDLPAAIIRDNLKQVHIPWREDLSNQDSRIARNALRADLIPQMAQIMARDIHAGAARTRRLLAADAETLESFARATFPEAYNASESIPRINFRSAPASLARRAMIAWLDSHGVFEAFSAVGFDKLLHALQLDDSKNRFSAGTAFVVCDEERIWLEYERKAPEPVQPAFLKIGSTLKLSTGAELSAEWVKVDADLLAQLNSGLINPQYECYANVAQPLDKLSVRALCGSDQYQGLGAPGHRLLKDCLMDRGIGQMERLLFPVVLNSDNTIMWVPQLPVAESYRINLATKLALKLTYRASKAL